MIAQFSKIKCGCAPQFLLQTFIWRYGNGMLPSVASSFALEHQHHMLLATTFVLFPMTQPLAAV
jgi:hypothetical protein